MVEQLGLEVVERLKEEEGQLVLELVERLEEEAEVQLVVGQLELKVVEREEAVVV